jgi:hypothetical protein
MKTETPECKPRFEENEIKTGRGGRVRRAAGTGLQRVPGA